MIYTHLHEVDSTNNYLFNKLSKGIDYCEGSVFYTFRQTEGRGQIGNSWESQPDKNIAFSILLKPTFIHPKEQFILSEIAALATVNILNSLGIDFKIKWPNDIYYEDRKVAGILIENRISGNHLEHTIIGIGINVDQTIFLSDAPNPISIKQIISEKGIKIDYSKERIMREISEEIYKLYSNLLYSTFEQYKVKISSLYNSFLYRKNGFYLYKDVATQNVFYAQLLKVESDGHLYLQETNEKIHKYLFKEVKFCLSDKLERD